MNVRLPVSIFFVVSLISIGCERQKKFAAPGLSERRQQGPARIEGAIVKRTDVDHSTVVMGTLLPSEETVLMPEASGRVVHINLPEGGEVAKGTVLLKLFDGDLQAQLKKNAAERELARKTLERMADLFKVNGISRTEYDNATLRVAVLEAEAELLSVQVRKTEVRAPFDGVLGLRRISIGAQVTPSTPLVTIRAVRSLKLDFAVPEKYAGDMRPGVIVSFTVAETDTQFTATVLATEVEISNEARSLPVRAIVNATVGKLTPGQFAKVTCRRGSSAATLMIPTNAIIADEAKKRVVVCRGGKALFVPIVTGLRRANDIEVIKGLAEGDTVATTGLLFLKPGMPLTFSQIVGKQP